MKKILLMGISVRAMAESAVRSGYPVVALDAFGDRDLRTLTESYSLRRDFGRPYSPENLHKAGIHLDFDSVAYTSNLENHHEILSRFSGKHTIIGNSPEAVARVRHWPELFKKLRRAGYKVPETIFLPAQQVPSISGRRWIEKPVLSGGGHGIRYFDPGIGSRGPGKKGHRPGSSLIQEHIPGTSCSAAFVANGKDSVVIAVAEQLIGLGGFGAGGFQYCGNIVPAPAMLDPDAEERILEELRELADFLTREFNLRGLNGIDFILRDGEVYVTEVNPRYTASMEIIETICRLPLFHLHVRSVLNSELPEFDLGSELRSDGFRGKSYLYVERDVTMPDTGNWTAKGIRDVPETGEKILKGGPVCTLFGAGATREDTLATMIQQAEDLKAEIYG